MKDSRPVTIWPALYIGVGIFGAIVPRTMSDFGQNVRPELLHSQAMIFIGTPILAIVSGVRAYFSLKRRSTPSSLQADMWNSPPTNPQSNQLGQVIFFGSLGASMALQAADSALRMFGLFGTWISLALLTSLLVFRARHRPVIK